MLKQLRHKRFTTTMSDMLSSKCYWYVLTNRNIVPAGNENDSTHERPDCDHT
ncbi:MAG: hypothetical protein ABL876_04040 [Chitinophagaceae bacterium]